MLDFGCTNLGIKVESKKENDGSDKRNTKKQYLLLPIQNHIEPNISKQSIMPM